MRIPTMETPRCKGIYLRTPPGSEGAKRHADLLPLTPARVKPLR